MRIFSWLTLILVCGWLVLGCGCGGGGGQPPIPGDINPPPTPYNVTGKVTLYGQLNHSGATVTAEDITQLGVVVDSSITNSAGEYYLWLPVGKYIVKASKTGFSSSQKEVEITSTVEIKTGVDFTLVPAKIGADDM